MILERLRNLPLLFNRLALDDICETQLTNIAKVDACLPQTQCGLCDHPDGCLPYAVSIVMEDEPHNKCVPGGQPVSNAIAEILQRPNLTARPSSWPIDDKTQRPIEVRAVIREEDCIGCTKCIPACPVDAIIGTGKHIHTIFADLCTGCELCLPPCPVDCIDLVVTANNTAKSAKTRHLEQAHLRQRYHTHLNRVAEQITAGNSDKPVTSMIETKIGNVASPSISISETQAKATIEAAKLRTKIKKLEKQLSVRQNASKQTQLDNLKKRLNHLNV